MSNDEKRATDPADAGHTGVNRRTMLKGAVGAGTVALTWTAPRIDTLGFAPAGASHFGSQCVILSPESDDKNSNTANGYCSSPALPSCCPNGQNFGNSGQVDTFTFLNPTPTCSKLVVRTIPLDCNTTSPNGNVPKPHNPVIGQFAVVIDNAQTVGTCNCTVFDAVLVESSQRNVVKSMNNGAKTCPVSTGFGGGSGVDASLPLCGADPDLVESSRLAVRITCESGIGCT